MREAGVAGYNSQYAKIYLNGKYLGLYLDVEPIDSKFLKKNDLSKKGNLYKATKDGACLSIFDDVDKVWEKKNHKKTGNEDLKLLIKQINTVSDAEFATFVKNNFVYDKLVTWEALNIFLANGSTYYHNYYMYHHPDGKWEIFPWDMDKTLSYYSWMPFVYDRTSSEWESDNPLVERMLLDKTIFADIQKKIDELSENLINLPYFESTIDEIKLKLASAVEQDNTDKIKSLDAWHKSLQQEKDFFKNRYSEVVTQFKNLPKGFKLNNFTKPVVSKPTFSWGKSISLRGKPISYTLYFSSDFLFKDTSKTVIIKNLKDTFYTLNKQLADGKYYWMVTSTDGEFETEGFNSKSVVVIRKPTILPEKISTTMILDESKSPYFVAKDITVEATGKLIIEKGVDVVFAESKNIYVRGQIIANGTKEKPVNFVPENANSFWGWIYLESPKEACSFNYVVVDEGVIQSQRAKLTIENSVLKLKNKSQGTGENRICMIWANKGEFTFRNNTMYGNSSVGEGLNINYSKAIVENSLFYNVSDAIEFIDINDGIISGNRVENSPDDAIDLNGCNNVKISNNVLINNKDKGVSVGTEQYGASRGIIIENNLIIGNNLGISVKDSSTAIVNNNILYENNVAIQLYKKREGYLIGGNAVVKNTIIAKSKKGNLWVDKLSTITISNSSCDTEDMKGTGNTKETPEFISPSTLNFALKTPNGKGVDIELLKKMNPYYK